MCLRMTCRIVYLYWVLYLFRVVVSEVLCPVSCNNTVTSDVVESFCKDKGAKLVERCCFSANKTSTLIGLDLRSCDISDLNITNVKRKSVEIMDLRNNSLNPLNTSEFASLPNLNYLYLPFGVSCPGGELAWNETKNITDKYTECYMQENPCNYLNVSCSINGQCLHIGPGSAKCVCKPGHHGYKCLQMGTFPFDAFVPSLVVPTIVISAFLWYYLRRNVVDSQKSE